MSDLVRKAEQFRALHVPGKPLLIFNIWDVGSARAVVESRARAIGTSSWAVANANGFSDGEQIPFPSVINNLHRIVNVTDVPVTIDLESGYGDNSKAVGETVARVINAGAVGCNLEDGVPREGRLRDTSEQAARIREARRAADLAGLPFFINARTDVFFQCPAQQHEQAMLKETTERARRYADSGADGIFVPGLIDIQLISDLVEASPLPVNIMMGDGAPTLAALADHGVARISYGAHPYLLAMQALRSAATTVEQFR
jgi:2-methylisocitrate lyase-like PEP mutase family enzyme